ncbi:MAG TPA: hypothetical protein VF940_12315 [Streptosporangiaceae bacterium]
MTQVILYQRPVFDPTFAAGELPPIRPRSRRHAMNRPQAQALIWGYRRQVADVADWPTGSYIDPMAEDCKDCCTF